MSVAISILPIVLTLVCGFVVARSGALTQEGWNGVEALSFRVLIPVVLIKSIGLSDLPLSEFGGVIWATVLTLALAIALVFAFRALRREAALPNPSFTTLFQTTTRWNAFIALAAAELISGETAVTLIAAAMAVLIPLINVVNITVLARYGASKATVRSVLIEISKNPLVQACALGLLLNLTNAQIPGVFVETLDLIGRAALGVGVLAVGAAIRVDRLVRVSSDVVAGVALRLIACPVLFLLVGAAFSLERIELLAGVLVFAAPAATNGYIIAKRMGGNAELYADILTWQTLISMALLPLYVAYAQIL